jgi:hypothetical protein
VLGYADDAIIVALALRSVVRRAGIDAVRGHWPGSANGFAAVCRITGLVRTFVILNIVIPVDLWFCW